MSNLNKYYRTKTAIQLRFRLNDNGYLELKNTLSGLMMIFIKSFHREFFSQNYKICGLDLIFFLNIFFSSNPRSTELAYDSLISYKII